MRTTACCDMRCLVLGCGAERWALAHRVPPARWRNASPLRAAVQRLRVALAAGEIEAFGSWLRPPCVLPRAPAAASPAPCVGLTGRAPWSASGCDALRPRSLPASADQVPRG